MAKTLLNNHAEYVAWADKVAKLTTFQEVPVTSPNTYPCLAMHFVEKSDTKKWLVYEYIYITDFLDSLMSVDGSRIKLVMQEVLKQADQAAYNAGMGGHMDDGGASQMRSEVAFFQHGLTRTMPKKWEAIAKKIENELDPEWDKYVELRKKFENV